MYNSLNDIIKACKEDSLVLDANTLLALQRITAGRNPVTCYLIIGKACGGIPSALANNSFICHYIVNHINALQFIQLIRIDERWALSLAYNYQRIIQLFYEPSLLLELLKTNLKMGHALIERDADLQQIILIQNLPEQYPEYLSFLVSKNSKPLSIVEYGLKNKDEYHPLIHQTLRQLIAKKIGLKFLFSLNLSLTKEVFIEVGRMYMDHLAGIEANPTRSLCEALTYLYQYQNYNKLSLFGHCIPKSGAYSDAINFEAELKQKPHFYANVLHDLFRPVYAEPHFKGVCSLILYRVCHILDPKQYPQINYFTQIKLFRSKDGLPRIIRLLNEINNQMQEERNNLTPSLHP